MVIRGRLLLVGTILVVGGLASGCQYGFQAQANQATDDTALHQTISGVHLANGSGDVSIQVGSTASVHRVVHYNGSTKPGPSTTIATGVLTLNDCGTDCTVDYVVTLPANAKIDGSTSSGDITVSGAASVNVESSSGNVSVVGVAGPVSVTTTSGDIKAAGSGADVQAHSSSGDITLSGVAGSATVQSTSGRIVADGLKGARTSAHATSGDISVSADVAQNLDLQASSGNVTITVPSGSYRVSTTTGSGDRKVGIGDDPNAQFSITAETTSGDVQISAK
ncbi:MAG TPA: DUF4097 family beta strand repeat-containing protein [Pseudonocardiaceae bacterium]